LINMVQSKSYGSVLFLFNHQSLVVKLDIF
jgi:hypothetical protein